MEWIYLTKGKEEKEVEREKGSKHVTNTEIENEEREKQEKTMVEKEKKIINTKKTAK